VNAVLERLLDGHDLSAEAAGDVMRALTDEALAPAVGGALLAALRTKGESADEVRGFAHTMRSLAVAVVVPSQGAPLVDTCGTGGDGSGSLNLSTAAGLIAAAAGARVVKHGNRSISSRSGSADVLETLGVPIELRPQAAVQCLAEHNFVFLFAPLYHPSMKHVMPIRRAMGVRTVFNMLGPLSNPAAPPHQVVGAFSLDAADKMAHALSGMGTKRAFVVHGAEGWDEATPLGPYHLFDVTPGSVRHEIRDPAAVGVPVCTAEDLAGGDAKVNAAALEYLLRGGTGPHRDAACLGAGLALEVSGIAVDLAEGIARASAAIDSGATGRLLDGLRSVEVK
jgi:anthranilate phosphoribosyltransferase